MRPIALGRERSCSPVRMRSATILGHPRLVDRNLQDERSRRSASVARRRPRQNRQPPPHRAKSTSCCRGPTSTMAQSAKRPENTAYRSRLIARDIRSAKFKAAPEATINRFNQKPPLARTSLEATPTRELPRLKWSYGHAMLFPSRWPAQGVNMLPRELSDQNAIARADKLCAKRKGPIDGFEVWDGARLIIKYSVQDADEPSGRSGRLSWNKS